MIFVLDNTRAEELPMCLYAKEDCIQTFDTLEYAAEILLKEYFEVYSKHGDPIRTLISYIPKKGLLKLLKDYQYTVGNSEKELWDKWYACE